MWSPAQLVGLHVDHAASGDGSGGGYLQVLRFEYEVLFVAHLYDLTAHETELRGRGGEGKGRGEERRGRGGGERRRGRDRMHRLYTLYMCMSVIP